LWPAARIDNILASVTVVTWFTILDLNAAFHQIAFSSEQDVEIAAFQVVTEDGLYQMRDALWSHQRTGHHATPH
jgi:hypothetical protein